VGSGEWGVGSVILGEDDNWFHFRLDRFARYFDLLSA
jgi:hypothetical protein